MLRNFVKIMSGRKGFAERVGLESDAINHSIKSRLPPPSTYITPTSIKIPDMTSSFNRSDLKLKFKNIFEYIIHFIL